MADEAGAVDIRQYFALKRQFFERHHYCGGDYTIAPPVLRVRPDACFLASAPIPQPLCFFTLLSLIKYSIMPPILLRWDNGKPADSVLAADSAQLLTAIEDIPAGMRWGVVQSLYYPPSVVEDGSRLFLATTATFYDIAGSKKYPMVIVAEPEDFAEVYKEFLEWWKRGEAMEFVAKATERGFDPKFIDNYCSGVDACKAIARTKSYARLASLRGESVPALILSEEPPLAAYILL